MSNIYNELDKLNHELMQHPPEGTVILGEVCRNVQDQVSVSYLIRYHRNMFRLDIIAHYDSDHKMKAKVKLLDAKGIEYEISKDTREFQENDFAYVVKNTIENLTYSGHKARA